MKTIAGSALVLGAFVCLSAPAAAQTLVGALAIDEGQGDQYGWAVDYETAGTAGQRALSECGSGCSVVLTFERCAAYAADQDAGSTVYGWAESYDSSAGARQRALAECGSRGSGCTVRVWGCNGPVVEEGLGLDRAARRQVQEGLQAAGFDPGGADGMFGPRTRAAIRSWQTSRGTRATGYLDGASVAALRLSVAGQPTFRERSPAGAAATPGAAPAAPPAVSAAQQQPPAASAEELVFWQSIADSTNPAEFEAYVAQFPNGVFRSLAEARLAALRAPANDPPAAVGRPAGGAGSPATGSRVFGGGGASFGGAAGVDAPRRPGDVFRDCAECPELVVVPAGTFTMGSPSSERSRSGSEGPQHRVTIPSAFAVGVYEATFSEWDECVLAGGCGEYRPDDGGWGRGSRPVTGVSWEDAQAYVRWLSARTGASYRLLSESEWEYVARAGTRTPYWWGDFRRRENRANCRNCGGRWDGARTAPAGSFSPNDFGVHDVLGNVWEWVGDCWHDDYAGAPSDGSWWTRGGDCSRRVLRGGSWLNDFRRLRSAVRERAGARRRVVTVGFRVSRTLD